MSGEPLWGLIKRKRSVKGLIVGPQTITQALDNQHVRSGCYTAPAYEPCQPCVSFNIYLSLRQVPYMVTVKEGTGPSNWDSN